jgi:hypothetical protein
MKTIIYINNMISPQCVNTVREELYLTGLTVHSVMPGVALVEGEVNHNEISARLEAHGFELLTSTLLD